MFHFKIVQIGETKNKNLAALIEEQLKRINQNAKIEITVIKDLSHGKVKNSGQKMQIMAQEEEKILQKIQNEQCIILLDENGKQFTSVEFAGFLEKKHDQGTNRITFVIGGCFGLSEGLKRNSTYSISLSKFTFTHEQARLLLLEQLYRALSIIAGREYHY